MPLKRWRQALFKGDNMVFRQLSRSKNNEFMVAVADPGQGCGFPAHAQRPVHEWILFNAGRSAEYTYTMRLKPAQEQAYREQSVDQAMLTIRNRIDQLGVGEVVIRTWRAGEDEILVQLPGLEIPARVKGIMQSTARWN